MLARGLKSSIACSFLAAAVVCLFATLGRAESFLDRGEGFEIGANAGAVFPISKYTLTIDDNVGVTTGFFVGYRWRINQQLAFSVIGEPQFTLLPTEKCCGSKDEQTSSMFILTAGPKLTLLTGPVETWLAAKGGYYRDMSGPIGDQGPGFNAGGGINFKIHWNSSIGLFGRYDYADMDSTPNSNAERQFAMAGVNFTHVFAAEAPPPPALAPPPPPAPPAKRKIVLRGVNFDFDKYNIRADARPILDEAIEILKGEPSIRISVEGHTDSIGTDAYNQRLSERRAKAVADYLGRGGIARDRMSTAGYGESRPVADDKTADGRAQNRRVELRVVGD